MNVRTSAGKVTCAKCNQETDTGFKIQGQSACVCAACLGTYALQQGVERSVTIDGIHKGNYVEPPAQGAEKTD